METFFSITIIILAITYVFADILVTLPDGQIRGRQLQTPGNETFYAFQGIPYATPPLKTLRFQPPTAPKKWSGILNTTKESKSCISLAYLQQNETESEDCLYLNVYTPTLNTSENLPVMFWIHGGFSNGSSTYKQYGPDFLIEEKVIVITINYRLGPFGFLSTSDEYAPGNTGLKDQNFALKWTNENIHLFGGNSSKITLFGHDAGAISVGLHVLSDLSAGLFRAAICQSGSALVTSALQRYEPRAYAFDLGYNLNKSILSYNTSTYALIDYLNGVPVEDIIKAYKILYDGGGAYLPCIEEPLDGVFHLRPHYGVLESGKINNVPLLIGITSEERLAVAKDIDALYKQAEDFDFIKHLVNPSDLKLIFNADWTVVGTEIGEIYVGNSTWVHNLSQVVRYHSDNDFTRGVIKHAELQSNHTDVYFYQFSYDGMMGNWNYTRRDAENVTHGEEINYLFKRETESFSNLNLTQFPEPDIKTHLRLVKIWTDFAKTMNPTPDPSELLDNIIWPKVTPENFQYLDIGINLTIKTNPKGKYYQGWNEIYEKYCKKPFTTF